MQQNECLGKVLCTAVRSESRSQARRPERRSGHTPGPETQEEPMVSPPDRAALLGPPMSAGSPRFLHSASGSPPQPGKGLPTVGQVWWTNSRSCAAGVHRRCLLGTQLDSHTLFLFLMFCHGGVLLRLRAILPGLADSWK